MDNTNLTIQFVLAYLGTGATWAVVMSLLGMIHTYRTWPKNRNAEPTLVLLWKIHRDNIGVPFVALIALWWLWTALIILTAVVGVVARFINFIKRIANAPLPRVKDKEYL